MTKSNIFRLLPMGAAIILALAFTPKASAQYCTNQSLKGNFGYSVTGTIVKSFGPLLAGPFVAVGKISFDGVGGVKTVRSLNDNGLVLQNDAGTGTYTMNSDCTGSFNVTVGPPSNQIILTLNIVLDGSYELRGVVTTADAVLAFDGRKQLPVVYF